MPISVEGDGSCVGQPLLAAAAVGGWFANPEKPGLPFRNGGAEQPVALLMEQLSPFGQGACRLGTRARAGRGGDGFVLGDELRRARPVVLLPSKGLGCRSSLTCASEYRGED